VAQMYLHVHLDGAHDYPVVDEIWHYGLHEAIAIEADATATPPQTACATHSPSATTRQPRRAPLRST